MSSGINEKSDNEIKLNHVMMNRQNNGSNDLVLFKKSKLNFLNKERLVDTTL